MKNLVSLLAALAVAVGVSSRAPSTTLRLLQTNNTTDSTNSTANYYKGVRCDWWCPDPVKG